MSQYPGPVQYAPQQPKPATGLAQAAMICGIIGLLIPLVGIVGLVLGIVALTKRKHPQEPGKGMAITGIVTGAIGIVMIPCLIAILLPSLNRARGQAEQIACASQMRQIGLAIQMYAMENRGALARDLNTILNEAGAGPQVLSCPSDEGTGTSYVYIKGLSVGRDSDKVVLYEPTTHHGGANFLFVDGHVEYQSDSTANSWITQLESGTNPPQ